MILTPLAALLLLTAPTVTAVPMPNGQQGIGFDDLRYSAVLGRVVVPAGRTGSVDLVDPKTLAIESIGGFTSSTSYRGGHGKGTTSADMGAGLLFASDRDAKQVRAADARTHQSVSSVSLQGSPDYVRWVEPLHEVWVTEPNRKQIEFFKLEDRQLVRSGRLALPDGPESLVVDPARGRAYTHAWRDHSGREREGRAGSADHRAGREGLALRRNRRGRRRVRLRSPRGEAPRRSRPRRNEVSGPPNAGPRGLELVDGRGFSPRKGELRLDLFGGEFSMRTA